MLWSPVPSITKYREATKNQTKTIGTKQESNHASTIQSTMTYHRQQQQQEQVISHSAEEAMTRLTKYGILTKTISSTMNLARMTKRFKCSDVFPIVETDLVRTQDRYNEKRGELAEVISTNFSKILSEDFTGNPKHSELVLLVRFTVVSDGSQRYKRISEYMGTGLAKVTLSYCLFARESGQVFIAKQLSGSDDARNSDGVPEALKLAEDLRFRLNREVKFICCSRLDKWPGIAESLVSEDSEDRSLY
jgi:hypothetical protein